MSDGPAVPVLLAGIHPDALDGVRSEAQETLHQVHLHVVVVLHIPM